MEPTIIKDPSEWSKVFSKLETINNYESSLNFIKELTIIAVSCISYLKNVTLRNEFTEETFDGLKIWILKKTCRDDAAQFLSAALTDAFDALDKRYLHQLALCIYEGECGLGNMIESHVFEYTYTDEAVSMNMLTTNKQTCKQTNYTFENIRPQIVHFIRANLDLIGSCQGELPSEYGLSLRLYYNEDTPGDYHAPGYIPDSGADHCDHNFEGLTVGRVETPHHKLSLLSYVKGNTFQTNHEAIPAQKPPMLPHDSGELDRKDRSASDRPQLLCLCRMEPESDPDTDDQLLTCYYCNAQQHAACFGVFGDATVVSRHCCAACRDADDTRPATDYTLVPLPLPKRAGLCLFRRALQLCARRARVDARVLCARFLVPPVYASKLMKMLHRHGVITSDPDNDSHADPNISEKHLEQALKKFANKKEENLADRLISDIEEAVFQESLRSNPIEEVLTPLEKHDLRETSNFSRVVEKPSEDSIVEDPVLNEYRQALVEDEIQDPLLSVYSEKSKETSQGQAARIALSGIGNKKNRLQLKKK